MGEASSTTKHYREIGLPSQEVDLGIDQASTLGNGGIGKGGLLNNTDTRVLIPAGESQGAGIPLSFSPAGDSDGLDVGGGAGSSLDEGKNNCNKVDTEVDLKHPCGCWVYHNKSTGQVSTFRCKRWNCPRCGKVNRYRLIKLIAKQAGIYGLQRFMTLTIDPTKVDLTTVDLPSLYLMDCWRKFRVYLERSFPTKIVYLWVKQKGEQGGGLHLHCLVSRYLPQAWISWAWSAIGGGRVVDIRWVDLHRVSAYLARYLTREGFEVDGRRYGSSQEVDLCLHPKGDGSWELVRLPCHHFVDSPELETLREWLCLHLETSPPFQRFLPVPYLT